MVPIVEGTHITELGDDGNIPSLFTIHFRAKVSTDFDDFVKDISHIALS